MNFEKTYDTVNKFLTEPRLNRLFRAVRTIFKEQDAIGHNWEHITRDLLNAAYIGEEEKADMNIVLPAIILHDIGYVTHPREPGRHPENGARECLRYLSEWNESEKELISDCILKHKGKYVGFAHGEPQSIEEMVVCDADQVDKFGWVGFFQVVKVFAEYGNNGLDKFKTLHGLAEGLKRQSSIKLYTETARKFVSSLNGPDSGLIYAELSAELSKYTEWNEPE